MSKTVFWSWQSDLPAATTKDFIKEALAQALEKVAEELQLEIADRLELDHDTKGEAGLVEIVSTIFRKIDDCQIFVADITPIAEITAGTATKKIPNPNVMLELGYAIREAGPQRVITVANLAFGGKPEELPFDLRHRRGAITYRLDSAKDPTIEKIRKNLVKQLVAALTTNLAAPREDQLLRNPMPALSVEVTEDIPKVLVVQQEVQLDDVPSLADVMTKTPLRTKAQQKDPASPFELFRSQPIDIFQRGRVKPFREWTEEELEGYNKRVQWYYGSYKTYLEQLKEYRLLRQRAVSFRLAVANQGTRPATDVWAKVTFPEGVLVYEDDDLPKAPDQPAPPPLAPHGIDNVGILHAQQLDTSFLKRPPRIDDDHKSMVFRADKIQQGFQNSFRSFTIVMSTQADIRSFEVSYQVAADELPQQKTGKLYVEVQQAE
ncbi:hypothetical protein [Paraburkholderia sp. MM5384-R2]|uniref:hypothetical protein n=1 Tax=Paraburkholderia sp. MM5384-R2 TaxID=2723097 RepID=UPI0016123AD6|nr:hypothetical protein [Paraburkholderia sp. MM5384-R2]MBB5503179.1 hypothetical protein [Paraburkholderia sp. MM5384-R2]